LARAAAIQELLADTLRDRAAPRDRRLSALRAMALSGMKPATGAWLASLAAVLADAGDAELVRQSVATARAWPRPRPGDEGLGAALLALGAREATPLAVRLDALAAVPGGLPAVSPALFAFLGGQLAPDQPVATRSAAAEILSKARF